MLEVGREDKKSAILCTRPIRWNVPRCKEPMRILALIDDPGVVRRFLEHLERWTPEASERGPPAVVPIWPTNAVIPFTYHPVPDIA